KIEKRNRPCRASTPPLRNSKHRGVGNLQRQGLKSQRPAKNWLGARLTSQPPLVTLRHALARSLGSAATFELPDAAAQGGHPHGRAVTCGSAREEQLLPPRLSRHMQGLTRIID